MSRREFSGGEEVGRARMLRLWNAEQVLVSLGASVCSGVQMGNSSMVGAETRMPTCVDTSQEAWDQPVC